jgi:predicted transcriptional regulator
LYLEGKTYSEIERITGHTAGSIKIYLGDFTRVLMAKTKGVKTAREIGFYIGRTERLVKEYLALITAVSDKREYQERMESLRHRMEGVEGGKPFKKGHSSMVWRLA